MRKKRPKIKRVPNCSCSLCKKRIYRRPSQLLAGLVFCSRACNGKSQRTNEKKCPECGKEFLGQAGGNQKNCSRKCADKSRKGARYNSKKGKNTSVRGNKLKERLAKLRGGQCEKCRSVEIQIGCLKVGEIIVFFCQFSKELNVFSFYFHILNVFSSSLKVGCLLFYSWNKVIGAPHPI